jgi:hypothetical protein
MRFDMCFSWQVWTGNVNVQFLAKRLLPVNSVLSTCLRQCKLNMCHTKLSGMSEMKREGELLCNSSVRLLNWLH